MKVFVEGGWVLVVPDPDHPSYHVIASTEDVKQAAALVEEYANLVQETVAAAHQEVQQVTERE